MKNLLLFNKYDKEKNMGNSETIEELKNINNNFVKSIK